VKSPMKDYLPEESVHDWPRREKTKKALNKDFPQETDILDKKGKIHKGKEFGHQSLLENE